MTTDSFDRLPLKAPLLDNLQSLGFQQMTQVQAESLPAILNGRDILAQSRTGSGKTAAFGLGMLHKLDVKRFRIQQLVLCPTRELAEQVAAELRRLGRRIHNIKILVLCGGVPIGPQIGSLEHGAHIVVGTPGRLEDHLRKGRLNLDHVDTLVLDEADRMLDMGFADSIDNILSAVPANRQTLLFSATFADDIRDLAQSRLNDPVVVEVSTSDDQAAIEQRCYRVTDSSHRIDVVRDLLLEQQPESALVFCNTKSDCEDLAHALRQHDFSAACLQGDMDQRERTEILVRFANRSLGVLIATDVAARGLDIDELDLVINFQLARDPEVHTHRIGRTGRGKHQGVACTLFSERETTRMLKALGERELSDCEQSAPQPLLSATPRQPPMVTLQVDAGKKQKIRPGDLLGALTNNDRVAGQDVGKISVQLFCAYVAVKRSVWKQALQCLEKGSLKGRRCRARAIN